MSPRPLPAVPSAPELVIPAPPSSRPRRRGLGLRWDERAPGLSLLASEIVESCPVSAILAESPVDA